MKQLPVFIPLLFITIVILAMAIFYRVFQRSTKVLVLAAGWLLIQALLGLLGFYHQDKEIMPRFLLLVLPPLVFILLVLLKRDGKNGVQPCLKWLALFHTIRVPVELILFCLFVYRVIPREMTFEGRNYDLLAGLSAPFVYYFGFIRKQLSSKLIIIWNIVSLGLLLNIVVIALLSMPTPIQEFGFGQPNLALIYFPYVWLPCGLVPMVIYAHLVTIRNLKFDGKPVLSDIKHLAQE